SYGVVRRGFCAKFGRSLCQVYWRFSKEMSPSGPIRWGADRATRGVGTDTYAAVAATQPYGLTAMRVKGVRYWWTGLGLLVLVLTYVAPVAASFRVPSMPARTTSLPALAIPAVQFPVLRVPKVHAQAPLAPLPKASTAAAPQSAAPQTTTRKVVRHRVPVVSDVHSQLPPKSKSATRKAKDPFAGVPIVDDSIGTPLNLQSNPAV